jgi:hypothetical protein
MKTTGIKSKRVNNAFTWNSGGHVMLDFLELNGKRLTLVASDDLLCIRKGTGNSLIYGDDDTPWLKGVCCNWSSYETSNRLKPGAEYEHPDYGKEKLTWVHSARDRGKKLLLTMIDGTELEVTSSAIINKRTGKKSWKEHE